MTNARRQLARKLTFLTLCGAVATVMLKIALALTIAGIACHAGAQMARQPFAEAVLGGLISAAWWLLIYFALAAVVIPLVLVADCLRRRRAAGGAGRQP